MECIIIPNLRGLECVRTICGHKSAKIMSKLKILKKLKKKFFNQNRAKFPIITKSRQIARTLGWARALITALNFLLTDLGPDHVLTPFLFSQLFDHKKLRRILNLEFLLKEIRKSSFIWRNPIIQHWIPDCLKGYFLGVKHLNIS